jgi:hypothetical protein
MDQLKALFEKKKKEADEEFAGRKFVRAKEVEELRLKRLREEEEADRARKVSSTPQNLLTAPLQLLLVVKVL